MRRLLAIAALGLGFAACSQATMITVHVFDFDFSTDATHVTIIDPTIQVGDTIHWVWDAGIISAHSSTACTGMTETWDSGLLASGGTFDHIFTHSGSFQYYCSLHGFDNGNQTAGGMSGVITVNSVPEPTTLAGFGLGALALIRKRRR